MERVARSVHVTQCEELLSYREMAEAVDLLCPWTALVWSDLQIVKISATATGEEEAGGMAVEFKVLQIVIVAC